MAVVLDGTRQFVPCGKCNFCLEARRASWTFRLQQEAKHSETSYFITLTYADEKLPKKPSGVSTLDKRGLQLFIKRLRKSQSQMVDKWSDRPLRYYAVGEYGTDRQRPHYHVLVFNMLPTLCDCVEGIWGAGQVLVEVVNDARIHYTTKFHVNAVGDYPGRDPPFALMSRKPGIGAGYFETHTEYHIYSDRMYTEVGGFKRSLPRYYRDKMFADRVVDLSQIPSEKAEYLKEIERLKKFHADPHAYFNERKKHAHERVRHKSEQNRKL